jgi:uncharacterized protein (DUF305 family)
VADAASDTQARRGLRGLTAALCVCVAAAVVLAALVLRSSPPGDDSPEAGFLRDMGTHHAQAVEMALLVRDKTADPLLRGLADDIIVTQSTQRGVFMGWLQQWGLAQSSAGPRMAWMPGHAHGAGESSSGSATPMPGMATAADIDRLRQAAGRDAEVLFLQLMIRHHEGGVEMARAIVGQSDREDVLALARNMEAAQAGEIASMIEMLAARNAQPLP